MKKLIYTFLALFSFQILSAQTGVGIGTSSPKSLLHVDAGAVLFSAPPNYTSTPGDDSIVQGPGIRFLWYPKKIALRVGSVINSNWDRDSIGYGSIALGQTTKARGVYSTAMGVACDALGGNSFAAGESSIAEGTNSIVLGRDCVAEAPFSSAMGLSTHAKGYGSISLGYYTTVKARGGIALGSFNDESDNPSPLDRLATDRIFQIGNGDWYESRSNAMTILRNGNTGIGELTPDAKLHVTANSTGTYPQLLLDENGNDYVRINFKNSTTNNAWTIGALPQSTSAASQMSFYYAGSGDVFKMYGNGNATLWGTLTQLSDARLKTNITPLGNSLSRLDQLSGYCYQWKDLNKDQSMQIGFLAQEVRSVFPELVREESNGTLSVNYSGFIPVVVESIKELKKENEELKKQVQWLMDKVSKQ